MRSRFKLQLPLGCPPVENIVIDATSRDELYPLLTSLQWIFKHPVLHDQVFELLENHYCKGKNNTGRPGMELWQILVLGVLRLGCNIDYDKLVTIANHNDLVRQMLGVYSVVKPHRFNVTTVNDNLKLFTEKLLDQINEMVTRAGLKDVFNFKDDERLNVKVDTYVMESNIHFPTDISVMFDAARKCVAIASNSAKVCNLKGWRTSDHWQKRIKGAYRFLAQTCFNGGANKEERVTNAAMEFLELAAKIDEKCRKTLEQLYKLDEVEMCVSLDYFLDMLAETAEIVVRRLINKEEVPASDKIHSIFEPWTYWVKKGKRRPSVELGRRIYIATSQNGLILNYGVVDAASDRAVTLDITQELLNTWGSDRIYSLSMDKGFFETEDKELLKLFIPKVVIPKRGKRNQEELAEEHETEFVKLRHQHSAVEANINELEHRGLDRCPDKGEHGFRRYTGLGILAYNCHKIGRKLMEISEQNQKMAA